MSAKNGKPCKKCGTSEWNKSGDCMQCDRVRDRIWRAANKDKTAANSRKWRQANKEKHAARYREWYEANKEKKAEYDRKWRAENQDKRTANKRKWYEANREKADAYACQWYHDHPGTKTAIEYRRRGRKTEAGGSYTAAEWKALVEHCGGKCLCCGRTDIPLTVDHVIPISKGGTSNIDNLQPLCTSCNSRKRDNIIDYRPGSGLGRWIQRKLFG